MLRTGWRNLTAGTMLVLYVALLTFGQALHVHRQPVVSPGSDASHVCCSHGPDSRHDKLGSSHRGRVASNRSAVNRGDSLATDARVEGNHVCLICRFLSQKPMALPVIRLIISTPLVGDADPLKPLGAPQCSARSFDARAPPQTV